MRSLEKTYIYLAVIYEDIIQIKNRVVSSKFKLYIINSKAVFN